MIQINLIEELLKEATSLINKASDSIEEWTDTIKSSSNPETNIVKLPSIVEEIIETLRMSDLTTVVRAHMPKNANAVAAYYSKTKNAYRITLTYLKEREILPKEENKVIVITSEFISREIENLFENRSVIILK